MTIMEMFQQGDFLNILIVTALFIFMVVMLLKIGNGVAARNPQDKDASSAPMIQKKKDDGETIAAISAAAKKYRQK